MSDIDYPEQTPEQAAVFQRVRRMMLIASITTAVAISAVLVAVGYRLFTSGGSAQTNDVTAMLPKGAKIYATAVAGDTTPSIAAAIIGSSNLYASTSHVMSTSSGSRVRRLGTMAMSSNP